MSDVNDRARAGDHLDPDAPGLDPELARLGAMLTTAASGSEVDRAEASAKVREVLDRRAAARAFPDKNAPVKVGDFASDVLAEVDARSSGRRRMIPVPWGDLQTMYDGGLRPGVHVLTGGTGTGKTGWALAVALEAARMGAPVLYAGLELDRVSIVARLSAQMRGKDNGAPGWADLDWPRGAAQAAAIAGLGRGVAELRTLPLYVAEPPAMGWSVDDLQRELAHVRKAEASRLADGWPILLVVDFLQLVGASQGDDGRIHPDDRELRGRIRRAAYTVRQLTRGNDVCALLVSAIARAAYDEVVIDMDAPAHPESLVGLGKESGEIEYAAHTVTVLARTQGADDVWAIVAKNRTGRVGYIALDFDGKQGRHYTASDARRGEALKLSNSPRKKRGESKKSGGKAKKPKAKAEAVDRTATWNPHDDD